MIILVKTCLTKLILFFQVDEVNSLVIELAKVTAKERALLEQCKDFLAVLAAMQVNTSHLFLFFIQAIYLIHSLIILVQTYLTGERL